MLWYKTLHIVFMVTWFAGLFYLPRLFVYHSMSDDKISHDRFIIMERKLFWGIMTPGGILTIIFGVYLIQYHEMLFWLKLKIFLGTPIGHQRARHVLCCGVRKIANR